MYLSGLFQSKYNNIHQSVQSMQDVLRLHNLPLGLSYLVSHQDHRHQVLILQRYYCHQHLQPHRHRPEVRLQKYHLVVFQRIDGLLLMVLRYHLLHLLHQQYRHLA